MICRRCGARIYDKAVKCPRCGAPTENYRESKAQKSKTAKSNGYGIAGFVLGLVGLAAGYYFCVVPLIGIIFSVIGIAKHKQYKTARKIPIWGLVLSIIGFIIYFALWAYIVGTVITAT